MHNNKKSHHFEHVNQRRRKLFNIGRGHNQSSEANINTWGGGGGGGGVQNVHTRMHAHIDLIYEVSFSLEENMGKKVLPL